MAQLEQELKRLQRRKTMDSSTVGVASTGSREQPLFTLRQVCVCVCVCVQCYHDVHHNYVFIVP